MRTIKFLKDFLKFKAGDETSIYGADICHGLIKEGLAEYSGEDAKKYATPKAEPKKATPKKAAKKPAPKD